MTDVDWGDDQTPEGVLTPRSAKVCLSEREIEDFVFNRLSGFTREVVEEHLLACAACVEKLEEEERFCAATASAANQLELEELARSARTEDKGPWWGAIGGWFGQFSWAGRGLAAGLAVAALVLVVVPFRGTLERPVDVSLHATRGVTSQQFEAVQAGRLVNLEVEVTGLGEYAGYRMHVVDSTGRDVGSANLVDLNGKLRWERAGPWPAGQYWVRLYGAAREPVLLREFALRLR